MRHRLVRIAGMLLGILVAVFDVATSPVVAGPAVREPVQAARGILSGTTTITWSGFKGITLGAPDKDFLLPPDRRIRLLVRDAEYAYVAIVPREQPPTEECYFPLPKCTMMQLLYVHNFHSGTYERGREFLSTFQEPALVHPAGKPLDIYLMTDGVATLVLEPKGLSGRTSYVAEGRISGGMEELPTFCPTPGCGADGYGGRYRVGGKTYDVGRLGYVAVAAHSTIPLEQNGSETESAGYNQSSHVRTCRYPNPANWDASPSAEDHPWGCDVVANPRNVDDTRVVAFQTYNQLAWSGPARGVLALDDLHGLTGRQYVGYHSGGFGASHPTIVGYGIWFRYGIHP